MQITYPTKDLYPEYIEHVQNSIEKTKDRILKWSKELNRHFTGEDRQMKNQYVKKSSTSQGIREIPIDIIIRFHTLLSERLK